MTVSTRTSVQVLSELISEAVRPHARAVGVIVRDVLSPDPTVLIQRLKAMHDEKEFPALRIAYLQPGGQDAAREVGVAEDVFTTQVEQAERWRNERDLKALIVVIARGDEAKLSSLEDFGTVTSQDLKTALVERAKGGPVGENDVQTLLWRILAEDHAVGLGQLVDYYLSLEGKDSTEFKTASSRELYRLGLLPDPALFESTTPSAMRKRLQSNRDIVERLQMLTPKDRRTIKQVVEAETDPAERAKLREALDQLHRTRSAGAAMGVIDYVHAERLVKVRSKKPSGGNDKPLRPPAERAADVASDVLVGHERGDDLREVLDNLRQTLESADPSSVRTEKVRTQVSDASTETFSTVRLDVVNLVAKMLDDGVYGGLVEIDLDDIDDLLRRFNVHEHVVSRWKRDHVQEVLEHIAEDVDGGRVVAEHFNAYDTARTATLPYLRALTVEPLVVAADVEARRKLLALVQAYEQLTRKVRDCYDEIFDVVGPDFDELVGLLLLTDIVVIRGSERLFALLSPVHPLFLWHHAAYAHVVESQRNRLGEDDKKLVASQASRLPNFLTSLYVSASALGGGKSLTSAGKLGQLPYYSDGVQGSASDDGVETITTLLAGYLAVEPHARRGLRVALVDPPDAGPYLRAMIDLRADGSLDGAHVVVYRHQASPMSVELRLDADDEDRVAQVFRASNMERRFTFEVRDRGAKEVGPREDEPFHVAIVFDRSGGQKTRTRPAAHAIQPLALPRRIRYSAMRKTIELEPGSGGIFEAYHNLVRRLSEGGGQTSYLKVHQQEELRGKLRALSQRVAWTVVADRHVDRDLDVGALRIFTGSDGDREIAAFARSMAAFRRPLRDVASHYNTFITDEELDDLLRRLSYLLDAGLLNVKPDQAGRFNESRIKGLLATLIAARWFRQGGQPGTRLLVSLDSHDARRWMHLSDDPLRADLVGFEWTNDHCTVTVIEVKSVEAAGSEYKIEDGIVSGPAVDQMLATRRLLAAILAQQRDDELITTPARREILREHLYRELTKGVYSPEERKLWADRVGRLLDGRVNAEVNCHLIDVRLGVDASTLRDRSVVAKDGDQSVATRVRELNEEFINGGSARKPEPGQASGGERAPAEGVVWEQLPGTSGGYPVVPSEPVPSGGESIAAELPPHRWADVAVAREATGEVVRPRALLGTAPGPYGKPREVWFDPGLPGTSLPNPHISITGETGSGKTQATKAIVSELRGKDVAALILDFKDDYSNESFTETEGFRLYDASFGPLPLNPLIPAIDKRQDLINPAQHVYQVADIVKRIYKLGDQQAFRLREAIKQAYEHAGIPLRPGTLPDGKSFPVFDAVRRELVEDKANEPLLGRLSPIFDLGLFSVESEQSNFDDFLEASVVIRLGQLPSDEVKNSVAEFFLMALYNHLVRRPQVHALGRLLVLDEAWRVVDSPFLTPLMREGRAFGLGVVIASQFPRDLPEDVRGSTATRLYFSQSQVEQIREIQRTIVGKTSGPEAEHVASVVRGLTPLSCVMHSTQYTPFVRVTVTPYFRRRMAVEDD